MDSFVFDQPSPDFGAEILFATSCNLWSSQQLPWECNADDGTDITDILSGHHCIQTATDAKLLDDMVEMSTPTTLDSVDSTTTTATAASAGPDRQLHQQQHRKGNLPGAASVAWPQSETGLGDNHLPETQLFSLPLNQLGQLGDELTTLLSKFENSATDAPGMNCSRKRAPSEESDDFQYSFSRGRERELDSMAASNQCRSLANSGNQADGSSTTTTSNSSPNCSSGGANSILLSDILRWAERVNSPAPGSGFGDNLNISFAEHRPPLSKKPRLLLDQDASCGALSTDFRRPTSRSGHEPDPEAIVKVKEMIYRAAVMRPVTLGREAAPDKTRRRNVRISSDPQTVAARERRERISDRLRVLQRLVPGGSKMDTATMLDEACNYLKFLKAQLAAGPKTARTSAGGKKYGAPVSSLSSRYPLPPLQSRSGFPASLETLVSRRAANLYQNPSFPSSRS